MNQIPLFYEEKTKTFFYQGEPVCSLCNKVINFQESGFVHTSFCRNSAKLWIYCTNCSKKKKCKKKKITGLMDELILFIATSKIPSSCILANLDPKELSNASNITTFDAALMTLNKQAPEHVTNHCRLAGKESWEGAQIGADVSRVIAEKDKVVDPVLYLAEMRKWKPVDDKPKITNVEKKLIGHNKKKRVGR